MELMSRVVIGNVFRALNGFFWRSKFNFAFFSIFHVQYLPWQALHGTWHTHLLKTWRSSYHSVSNLQFGCTTKKYNSISCPRFVFSFSTSFFHRESVASGRYFSWMERGISVPSNLLFEFMTGVREQTRLSPSNASNQPLIHCCEKMERSSFF